VEVKVTPLEQWTRRIEVSVRPSEVAPKVEQVYREYQKGINLEGFRKGKVPRGLLKKLYGKEIEAEAIDQLVPELYRQALEREGIQPVAPGKIEGVHYDEERGLTFTATVDVEPEIEPRDYIGLRVEREVYEMDDEDVAGALEAMREGQAVIKTVEGEAQPGHFVVGDLQQLDASGLPIIGHRYPDRMIEVGTDDRVGEMGRQLVGVRAGEKRPVRLTPRRGPSAQEELWYQVTVKEVKERILPALDDELAKDVGDFENLEALRAHIRKELEARAEREADRRLLNRLAEEVVQRNPFELPPSMVEHYLDRLVEQAKEGAKEKIDEGALRESYRAQAIWTLKWILLRDRLAKKEALAVTPEDIEARIALMAQARKVDERRLRNRILSNEEELRRLKEDLLEEKVLNFLKDHAKIKERVVKARDRRRAAELIVPE